MNFIITAGGTSEKIDSVRLITNISTGALGVKIAESVHMRFPDADIYFVCGLQSLVPELSGVKIIRVTDTGKLLAVLTELMTSVHIDAVIHSMAVSDYRVRALTTAAELAEAMAMQLENDFPYGLPDKDILGGKILACITDCTSLSDNNKISSELKSPLILLERTPKVIGHIKELRPDTILVGFKLLSKVPKDILINTAYALLVRNRCDLVFANDVEGIKEGSHDGYLIDSCKNTTECHGKENIAEVITNHVAGLLKAKGESI